MARTAFRPFGLATAGAAVLCCAARATAQDTYGEFLGDIFAMAQNVQEATPLPPGVGTIPNGDANDTGAYVVDSNGLVTNVERPRAVQVDEVYVGRASGKGFTLVYTERAETVRGPQAHS